MSPRALAILIKTAVALFVIIIGATFWYFVLGRKPRLAASVSVSEKWGATGIHQIDPDALLLVSSDKATYYDIHKGAARWSVVLAPDAPAPKAAAAATPAPKVKRAEPPPTAPPKERPGKLEQQRVQRMFAKLETWAAKLNQRRGQLKTQLQIDGFNEEAKRYHAELAQARVLHAAIHGGSATEPAPLPQDERDEDMGATFYAGHDAYFEKTEALGAGGSAVLLVRGSRAALHDRANGAVRKEFALVGKASDVMPGSGCAYVVSVLADRTRDVTRVPFADGTVQVAKLPSQPGGPRYVWSNTEGVPPEPNIPRTRTEISALGGALLQAEIRVVELKVTTHAFVAADAESAMEEADRNTRGGWASDALVFAQAMEKDAQRDATGGKQRVDESIYEVTLTRPFDAGVAPTVLRVQGRPEIFSTASLDLLIAGRTLTAFDHANKKLWEAKLAYTIADPAIDRGGQRTGEATAAHPCMEVDGQIFVFDRGYVSAFATANGQPKWRMPSIGIQKLQHDGRGVLYVTTANLKPEALGHPDGGGLAATAMSVPLTMKIDAQRGKLLWKIEKYDMCIVSGGALYATRETRNAEDMVNAVFDRSKAIQCRFKLYKLSTRTGEPQWEWFQTRRPLAVEAHGRDVALLFADELQFVNSIAL